MSVRLARLALLVGLIIMPTWVARAADDGLTAAYAAILRGDYEAGRTAVDSLLKDRDPAEIFFQEKAFEFSKQGGGYVLRIHAPFLHSGEIDLMKDGDELVLRVGSFKRYVSLPRRVAALEPSAATLEEGDLQVVFGGPAHGQEGNG